MNRRRARKPENARTSPLAASLPEADKKVRSSETRIPTYIRALQGDFGPDDRAHIRRKLGRRLGKFARSIERVSVRTEDVNGPRGGVDRVCRIKVVLRGLPSVVFEKRDASLHAAVDLALAGVERAVRRSLQRRRMKPLRRGSGRAAAHTSAWRQHTPTH